MSFALNQMSMVSAIADEIVRQGKKRGLKKEDVTITCRTLNLICDAASKIVVDYAQPFRPAVPGSGYQAWLQSDDVGTSSKVMARYLISRTAAVELDYPRDADDFGRCYRMLRACNINPERVIEMTTVSTQWAALSLAWPILETLHEANNQSELSNRIDQLTREAGK